jgi:hypothetical protein
MTSRTRYFVVSSLLVLVVGVGTGLVAYFGVQTRAFSVRGGPEELRYLPADSAVVAFANVRQVMGSQLRQRFRQAAPGEANGRRELEEQTGINVETDIDHVVACLLPDTPGGANASGLVLAVGTFNEVKIEALMRDHGATVTEYKGKRIVVAPPPASAAAVDPNTSVPSPQRFENRPEFALSFLKPGLVAFGTSNLLRRAIDLETGGDSLITNEEMMNLVRSLESGDAWAVGRFDVLRASGKLPEGVKQLPPISLFSVTSHIGEGVDGVIRAEATTDEAAQNLRDVVQGFIALGRLQIGSKPALQGLMQSLQISGSGKTVSLSFSVSGQVLDMITPAARPAEKAAH